MSAKKLVQILKKALPLEQHSSSDHTFTIRFRMSTIPFPDLSITRRVTDLFGISYPIISGGMVWCSGHELASAVSEAGGLGLIGSGSMAPDVLRLHIQKTKASTVHPFGVNVPLMSAHTEENIRVILEEEVPVVFTSAGNPKRYTSILKGAGIRVAHVVSSSMFALKAEDAGVDAVVAEGFEAGGHNGKEETTTLCLIPAVAEAVSIPVIAAGGIASGAAMAAMFCLGASGVQLGTAFALTHESSGHDAFKEYCTTLGEGDTRLMYKAVSPTRLAKGAYFDLIKAAEARGASADELRSIRGLGRSRKGMFEGDLEQGELEIGQVASEIDRVRTVQEVMNELVEGLSSTLHRLHI